MNIEGIFDRTRLLVGDEAMEIISSRRVIIFGIGGVGSWCVESLARSGIRRIAMVDADKVCPSNINRQIMATCSTIGQPKVRAMKERILDINPDAEVSAIEMEYNQQSAGEFDLDGYDYVIDAIDSLSDKALLILNACLSQAKLFSSMGAALKLDPRRISVAEFWKVQGCPLAAALRRKFRREGVSPARKFQCVYSDEIRQNRGVAAADEESSPMSFNKASVNGAVSHATAVFGLMLASLVIQDIIQCEGK